MSSITDLWTKSRETFEKKSLAQILSFAGDGKLKDDGITSAEFRELLDKVTSQFLKRFADSCLNEKFDGSGFALQDIINQIGKRLSFSVEYGLYHGRRNQIGFDGIWTAKDGHCLILEVKTTDAYRINLDVISDYRVKLANENRISLNQSSILIVVGREDTGDLEAQIRGSQHAWDIRLISTDALLNLLSLKEALNDTRTIQQINELLKPREYTRVDKLIELIFETTKDLQIEETDEIEDTEVVDVEARKKRKRKGTEATIPVSFHEECINKIQRHLDLEFLKQSRVSYKTDNNKVALTCAISKAYKQGLYEKYWFAFHPHQRDFLKESQKSYVAFGCGTSEIVFLIPFEDFEPLIDNMWTTQNDDRKYHHVVIYHKDGGYLLAQPESGQHNTIDINHYRI